jgi:hypothetical protein
MFRQPRLFFAMICLALLTASAANAAADLSSIALSSLRVRSEQAVGGDTVVGHGTAMAIDLSPWGYSAPRYMLSAFHVYVDQSGNIRPRLKVEVRQNGMSSWINCRVAAYNKALDVCILETERDLPYLTRLSARELEEGDPVVLVGSPRGIPITIYHGKLTEKEYRNDCSRMEIEFDHGDSGAPVFERDNGEVIGVAVAGISLRGGQDMVPNVGLFVPASSVMRFLDTKRIGPPTAPQQFAAVPLNVVPQSDEIGVSTAVASAQGVIIEPVAQAPLLSAAPQVASAAKKAPIAEVLEVPEKTPATVASANPKAAAANVPFFKENETPLFLTPKKPVAETAIAKAKPKTPAAATAKPKAAAVASTKAKSAELANAKPKETTKVASAPAKPKEPTKTVAAKPKEPVRVKGTTIPQVEKAAVFVP